MDSQSKVSLALTHFNRPLMLMEAIAQVKDDPRIAEIVISDDSSPPESFETLKTLCSQSTASHKFRLHQNPHRLDCHFNKRQAVERTTLDWLILFDDDNVLGPDYIHALYHLPDWDPRTVYCPVFAKPYFDYRAFAGMEVDHTNVARLMKEPHFTTALNTCNYFVNRSVYLQVWDGSIDPHTADSIYTMMLWLEKGNRIHFVPGLEYLHRVHGGSHFKRENHKTGDLARWIERKLREMR